MDDDVEMGADNSVYQKESKKWYMEKEIVYETDTWEVHRGVYSLDLPVSVIQSKNGRFNANSLEYSAKFLRTLRHPYIIKHISSHQVRDCYYLITELSTPLDSLLQKQNIRSVEITAGLFNLLQALEFIHDKCHIRHNNVKTSSVFISVSGCWKLNGFELAEKYICLNGIEGIKTDKQISNIQDDPIHAEDIYAFGKLAILVLSLKPCLENLVVQEFLTRIEKECFDLNHNKRPKSVSLQTDLFFNNDFLRIKMFLQSLVLKSIEEKDDFFKNLPKILSGIDPLVLATQLLPLLMSRIVFLNSSAKTYLLPLLLKPKTETTQYCFLSSELFKEFMIPQLKSIFQVHDYYIRLTVLEYFSYFAHLFPEEDLKDVVLPEVLFGIRDINDELVAVSLQALSTLVLILGAKVVIGQNCHNFFTKNSPGEILKITHTKHHEGESNLSSYPSNLFNDNPSISTEQVLFSNDDLVGSDKATDFFYVKDTIQNQSMTTNEEMLNIPERSSPDGGESEESEKWSDWEEGETTANLGNTLEMQKTVNHDVLKTSVIENTIKIQGISTLKEMEKKQSLYFSLNQPKGLGEEFDIMALEIKPIKSSEKEEDYFADMLPKITLSKVNNNSLGKFHEIYSLEKQYNSKFTVPLDLEEEDCCGWDDSELDIE